MRVASKASHSFGPTENHNGKKQKNRKCWRFGAGLRTAVMRVCAYRDFGKPIGLYPCGDIDRATQSFALLSNHHIMPLQKMEMCLGMLCHRWGSMFLGDVLCWKGQFTLDSQCTMSLFVWSVTHLFVLFGTVLSFRKSNTQIDSGRPNTVCV